MNKIMAKWAANNPENAARETPDAGAATSAPSGSRRPRVAPLPTKPPEPLSSPFDDTLAAEAGENIKKQHSPAHLTREKSDTLSTTVTSPKTTLAPAGMWNWSGLN